MMPNPRSPMLSHDFGLKTLSFGSQEVGKICQVKSQNRDLTAAGDRLIGQICRLIGPTDLSVKLTDLSVTVQNLRFRFIGPTDRFIEICPTRIYRLIGKNTD